MISILVMMCHGMCLRERAGCRGPWAQRCRRAPSCLGTLCEQRSEMSWGCCLTGGQPEGSQCPRAVSGGTGGCCGLSQELMYHGDGVTWLLPSWEVTESQGAGLWMGLS